MLNTEISAILDVARACVWANRVDLLVSALHETCHAGKAAGLEYLRAGREGERTTGARQMRPATPAAAASTNADVFRDVIERRFRSQNGPRTR